MTRWTVIPLMAAFTASCGLIDADVTTFDLSMPERTFTVDTDQWALSAPGGVFPDIPCQFDANACTIAEDEYCGTDRCRVECVAQSCELTVRVSLQSRVELYNERPELQSIDDQPLVEVSIENVHYTVTENTLNFDTPAFTLYLAPQNVMSAPASEADEVGHVPSIPRSRQQARSDVEMSPEGKDALSRYMRDYRTPFNLILSTEVTLRGGDPLPMGRISADVGVDASARAGL